MKKVLFVVNKETETSIPLRWYKTFKRYGERNFYFSFTDFSKGIKIANNFDIFHLHHPKSASVFSIIGKILRKKLVYTNHGSYEKMDFLNKLCFALTCIFSDRIVFVNDHLQKDIPNYLKPYVRKKMTVIYNSINTKEIREIANKNSLKVQRKYKIPSQKYIIFHPARFVLEKNHINILKALELLKKEYSDFLCLFAGDGKLKEFIEKLAKRLKLEDNVLFLGTIPHEDTLGIMKLADLFIMPSTSEGLNTAFLEALALRKKILISNIASYLHFFEQLNLTPQDVNVFVCETNYKSIYKNIHLLLKAETSFNQEAYDKIESVINIESMVKKYLSLYKEIST